MGGKHTERYDDPFTSTLDNRLQRQLRRWRLPFSSQLVQIPSPSCRSQGCIVAGPIPATVIAERIEVMAGWRRFHAAGRPIVHIVRLYVPGGSDVDLPRRAAIEGGGQVVAPHSRGAEIPEVLLPRVIDLDCEALLAGQAQKVARTR